MARLRWFISPTVIKELIDPESGSIERYTCPKVASMLDVQRGKFFQHTSEVGPNWSLSLVLSQAFVPLVNDIDSEDLFEEDFDQTENFLPHTPRGRGWNNARLNRVKNRIANRGAVVSDLGLDTPIEVFLNRLGEQLNPKFNARKLRIG